MRRGAPTRVGAGWLRFDPQRPTRPGLLRQFVAAVVAMMVVCALLALATG